jgi:hypothetical protein
MAANPPNTSVRTSHAITIRANGETVGVIQSWNPGMNRGITAVYELNVDTSGEPTEKVPGNLGGLTISVSRYDLYNKRMERAFGISDSGMLSDQKNPFQVLEYWRLPDNSQEVWIYQGCWFSNLGRTYSATDARLVLVNGTIEYTKRLKA